MSVLLLTRSSAMRMRRSALACSARRLRSLLRVGRRSRPGRLLWARLRPRRRRCRRDRSGGRGGSSRRAFRRATRCSHRSGTSRLCSNAGAIGCDDAVGRLDVGLFLDGQLGDQDPQKRLGLLGLAFCDCRRATLPRGACESRVAPPAGAGMLRAATWQHDLELVAHGARALGQARLSLGILIAIGCRMHRTLARSSLSDAAGTSRGRADPGRLATRTVNPQMSSEG